MRFFFPSRTLVVLALSAVSIAGLSGCDTAGSDDDSPSYREVVETEGSFTLRSIYGLNDSDDFNRVIEIASGLVYDSSDKQLSITGEDVDVAINGVSLASDDFEFSYQPGAEYVITASVNDESVSGTVTAPSISSIEFADMPDTLDASSPITVKWAYPEGETNDGAILFSDSRHVSELLPPNTTSYTLPEWYDIQEGERQFQIMSVRFVEFPNLLNALDFGVSGIRALDARGSHFATFVGQNRYFTIVEE
jgi:hypothetical protein